MPCCSLCHQDLPQEAFVYRKDRQSYQSHCKKCKQRIDRAWALANPDRRRRSKTKCDRKLRTTKITTKLKDGLRSRLNTALKTYQTGGTVSHIRHLGCSMDQLIKHLESQFHPHPTTNTPMTWENRGNKPNTWQLDHIIPLCSASSPEELMALVHYSNLRPLWYEAHLAKSSQERSPSPGQN